MDGSCDQFCGGSELWFLSPSSDSKMSNEFVVTKVSFSRAVAVQAFSQGESWQATSAALGQDSC